MTGIVSQPMQHFRFSYEQRVNDRWETKTESYNYVGQVAAAKERLQAYIDQMAETEPGEEYIRNISPVEIRDITYSEWRRI